MWAKQPHREPGEQPPPPVIPDLDCSTTSECMSTCAAWGTCSKTRLVDIAPWGMSSVICCTSKLKESEAGSVEECAAWGVSAWASFCRLDAATSKALKEPIPSGLSSGFHYPCFCLCELTGFLPLSPVLEQGCFTSHLLSFDNNKVLKIINWIC